MFSFCLLILFKYILGDLSSFLTFLALILAYLAYSKNVEDKYESWKSLLVSFNEDINSQRSWLFNNYYEGFSNNSWYFPDKIIYCISFESLKEIIRKGISDSNIFSEELSKNISFFNERVEAFNQLLGFQRILIASNPKLSFNLLEFKALKDLEKIEIKDIKNVNLEEYAFSQQLYFFNKIIHINLIGNENNDSSLHFLAKKCKDEIEEKLKNFDNYKPSFIRNKIFIISLGIFFYMIFNIYF